MHIGDIIKIYRESKGYTVLHMGSVIGVEGSTYWRKERGKVPFTDAEIRACAAELGVAASELYRQLEAGEAPDQRRLQWNAAYDALGKERADQALRLLIDDQSSKHSKRKE